MELFSRVILLAACVLTAYSLPTKFDVFQGQAACNTQYQTQQQNINFAISVQTTNCIAAANATMNYTFTQLAPEANFARDNLTALETNLNNCTSISDNYDFVICVNNDYNQNQALLNTGFALSADVQNQVSNSLQSAQKEQQNCIGNVLSMATKNFTTASQEYNECMNNIFSPTSN